MKLPERRARRAASAGLRAPRRGLNSNSAATSVFTNSLKTKLPLASSGKSLAIIRPARATMRDVRAIVTERGAGCDGRCGVRWQHDPGKAGTGFPTRIMLKQGHRTKTPAAYGEVVWSWRRDRGAKLARSIALTTVARNAAHRGEHV